MIHKILLTGTVSFLLVWLLVPKTIPFLTKLKFGQVVREEGPSTHYAKTGTPTMGGVVFILSIIFVYSLFIDKQTEVAILIIATLGLGGVGFLDDYIKVVKKRNLGLRAYQKIIGQIIFAGMLVGYQFFISEMGGRIYIPILNEVINLGYLYFPFAIIVVIGIVNSVNLTDGLDGLASGVTIVFLFFLGSIFYLAENTIMINENFFLIIATGIGSLIGFLVFNKYPARIFMGDVGSLALGGLVASLMILTGTVIIFPILGAVFMAETLSVVIQVVVFKRTGRRVFLMSPLHHHYEQKGFTEKEVVRKFWLVSVVFGCVSVVLFLI